MYENALGMYPTSCWPGGHCSPWRAEQRHVGEESDQWPSILTRRALTLDETSMPSGGSKHYSTSEQVIQHAVSPRVRLFQDACMRIVPHAELKICHSRRPPSSIELIPSHCMIAVRPAQVPSLTVDHMHVASDPDALQTQTLQRIQRG